MQISKSSLVAFHWNKSGLQCQTPNAIGLVRGKTLARRGKKSVLVVRALWPEDLANELFSVKSDDVTLILGDVTPDEIQNRMPEALFNLLKQNQILKRTAYSL